MSVGNPSEKELRDILFLFEETNIDSPYYPPFILGTPPNDAQLGELTKLLGVPALTEWTRKELIETAEAFCLSLSHQEAIPLKYAKKRIEVIRNSARKLLDTFNVIESSSRKNKASVKKYASAHTIPFIQPFMRMGASEYARNIHQQYPDLARMVPWNFWGAYRLPSAIQSVELLEHWAELAIVHLDNLDKKSGARKGNQGKIAARVMIQRLARAWQSAKGALPGAGYSTHRTRADGPFIRFSLEFIEQLRTNATAEQKGYLPSFDKELNGLTEDSIRGHLKAYKAIIERNRERAEQKRREKASMAKSDQ